MALKKLNFEKITGKDSEKYLQSIEQVDERTYRKVLDAYRTEKDDNRKEILENFLLRVKADFFDSSRKQKKEEVISKYLRDSADRNKILSLFYKTFIEMIPNSSYKRCAELADQLEEVIFLNGDLSNKSLLLSKIRNLKNKGNRLALKLYREILLPLRFIKMSSEEMRSKALINEETEYIIKGINTNTVPKIMTETDLFQCAKCGQKKASYRQLQTRSADEPMTTFVYCVCGNVWKF